MGKWAQTVSSKKPCRIKLDQVVAVVEKRKGHVEVFLRGGHSLTVEGGIDAFAPQSEGVEKYGVEVTLPDPPIQH